MICWLLKYGISLIFLCDCKDIVLDKCIFFYVYICLGGGVLGLVVIIVLGFMYYIIVYNFDSMVDGVDIFRFICIVRVLNIFFIN